MCNEYSKTRARERVNTTDLGSKTEQEIRLTKSQLFN